MIAFHIWLIKNWFLSCYFRWVCCSVVSFPPTSSITTPFYFWGVLSHWLSWHMQTETLLASLKAFCSPPVLLEATKHRLSWPAITFSPCPLLISPLAGSPPSPSLSFFPPAHWHLNFPSFISLSFISISFDLTFTASVYHVFSILLTNSFMLHALFLVI